MYLKYAEILIFETRLSSNSDARNERIWTDAAHKLLEATKVEDPTSKLYCTLQHCLDALVSSPKDRKRNGGSVYLLCAEDCFVHNSGLFSQIFHHGWNKCFLLCDDTKVYFYDDIKKWENGPCSGIPKTPNGKNRLL